MSMANIWNGAYDYDRRAMELHRAAKAGDTSSVLSYIEGGTDVDSRDSLEATCLYWAVSKHHEDLVESLLQLGADANAKTKWGSTSLHAAADRGFLKIAQKLLEYGADCNIANNNSDTPLHMACMRGHLAVIQLLVLNGGAELSRRNLQGRTPRDEADSNGMTQATVFLKTLMENASRHRGSQSVVEVSPEPATESPCHITERQSSVGFEQQSQSVPSSQGAAVSETARAESFHKTPASEDVLYREKFEIIRADHQRLVQEKSQLEEEKNKTVGDLQAVRQKLSFCQSRLEETTVECENMKKEAASLRLQLSTASTKPHMKSKTSQLAKQQQSCRVLQPALIAGLLEAVSVDRFQTAQSLLASCIESFEAPHLNIQKALIPHANHPWDLNRDFEIIGDGPLNLRHDGRFEGSCSLVFRIRHVKFGVLVLKMMNNLINMLQGGHGIGFSATPWLHSQFAAEHDIPLTLPRSPYILPVLHHYKGSTAPFQQFIKYLVPQGFDVPLEMAGMTTFLVTPEYETTLDKWISKQKRQYPQPPFGIEEWNFLLILYQLLCGVHHLISNGVVHRDLKGANILMSGWEVVIGDFGLARRVTKSVETASQAVPGPNQTSVSMFNATKAKSYCETTRDFLPDTDSSPLRLHKQRLCLSVGSVQFVEKNQVFAGNAHAWAPELARWSRSGPLPTTTTSTEELTLLDIYAKSDTFAIGRMFFNLLRESGSTSPGGSSWEDSFPASSAAKPHYGESEIPTLPSCYSPVLRNLLKNMVLDEPMARKETQTLINTVGLMLWGPHGQISLASIDDCSQWLLKEQFDIAVCEDDDYKSLSLAGCSLTPQQLNVELKKRFVCEVQPQALWDAYKTLALFTQDF